LEAVSPQVTKNHGHRQLQFVDSCFNCKLAYQSHVAASRHPSGVTPPARHTAGTVAGTASVYGTSTAIAKDTGAGGMADIQDHA